MQGCGRRERHGALSVGKVAAGVGGLAHINQVTTDGGGHITIDKAQRSAQLVRAATF